MSEEKEKCPECGEMIDTSVVDLESHKGAEMCLVIQNEKWAEEENMSRVSPRYCRVTVSKMHVAEILNFDFIEKITDVDRLSYKSEAVTFKMSKFIREDKHKTMMRNSFYHSTELTFNTLAKTSYDGETHLRILHGGDESFLVQIDDEYSRCRKFYVPGDRAGDLVFTLKSHNFEHAGEVIKAINGDESNDEVGDEEKSLIVEAKMTTNKI